MRHCAVDARLCRGLLRPSRPGGEGGGWLRKLGGCVHVKPPSPHVDRSAFAGFRFPPEVITGAVGGQGTAPAAHRTVERR
jgi:hypothetical protein